jgi:hypothetical protein
MPARQLVFLSYAREDASTVHRLVTAVQREVAAQAGDPENFVFWSDAQIAAGDAWNREIESAMNRASVFLLFLSPAYVASRYAMLEAGVAIGRASAGDAILLPILLGETILPSMLRTYQYVDARRTPPMQLAQLVGSAITRIRKDALHARVHTSTDKERTLRLFVSSSLELTAERDCVKQTVKRLNAGMTQGVAVYLAIAESDETESVTNVSSSLESLIGTAEIFVGILATRFGSAETSGRQQEFETAIRLSYEVGKPRIMLYFKEEPFFPRSEHELDEFRKILDFRQRIRSKLLYATFVSLEDFRKRIHSDLNRVVVSESGRLTRQH